MPSTQVWQIEDGWNLFLTAEGKARRIAARAVLLANGAQERPVPFAGWTLPGVMTVGAAQILLKSGGMLPEGKVWIAGAGPLPLLYATQLLDLGGRIAGFLDTSTPPRLSALSRLPGAWRDFDGLLKGLRWLRGIKRSGVMVRGFSDLRAEGNERLEHLTWEVEENAIASKRTCCWFTRVSCRAFTKRWRWTAPITGTTNRDIWRRSSTGGRNQPQKSFRGR